MLGYRWGWAAWPLAALAVGGCANLDTVTASCGNGVVESGEDCDQQDHTTSGDACGTPGTTAACRFICDTGQKIACPTGWACGVDKICRNPIAQSWTSNGVLVPQGAANDLLVSDFDSDGVADVVAVAPPSVDLHFFETSRTSTTSTSLIDSEPGAAVGRLTKSTGTYGPNLLLDLSQGLGVFTGETNRTLSPVVYATATFANQQYQIAPYLNGIADLPTTALSTAFVAYGASGVSTFTPGSTPTVLDVFTAAQTIVGTGVVGRFDQQKAPTQMCDWFALALNDATQGHVRVYSPCSPLITDVKLPLLGKVAACEKPPCTGTTTSFTPVRVYDINHDGMNDLVVAAGDTALHVAYSYGNGHFGSTAPTTPPGPADDTFSPAFANFSADNGVPLAIGDLNGDGLLDIVDPTGIYIGQQLVASSPIAFSGAPVASPDAGRTWTEAVLADLNADGFPDVAVGSNEYPGITLYRGTGDEAGTELFNPVDIDTVAGLYFLAAGDFDGDLVNDLVFSTKGETVTGATTTSDTVYISFGARSGPPADPVVIGEVPGIVQIVPGYESELYQSLVSDAFVVGVDPTAGSGGTDTYLFPGDTSRQIEAPYFLIPPPTPGTTAPIDGPRRSIVGSFSSLAGSGDSDIAVFAKPFGQCNPSCNSRLWLLPTQGGGALVPADTKSGTTTPFPTALGPSAAAANDALLGNLGPPSGASLDELVIVVPTAEGSAVVTGSASSGTFTLGTEQSLPGFYITQGMAGAKPTTGSTLGNIDSKLLTADLDGDGHLDLVLASAQSGLAVVLSTAQGLPSSLAPLLISYDDLTAECAGTAISAGPPVPTSTPPVYTIGAAAFPAAATSAAQTLVVMVTGGAVLVGYDRDTQMLTKTCLTITATTNGATTIGPAASASTQGDAAASSIAASIPSGTAVAVGDFDGDGIQDIVVSQSSGLNVYYGNSYPPGQSPASSGGAP